jgi:hypothetical protein
MSNDNEVLSMIGLIVTLVLCNVWFISQTLTYLHW